MNFITFSQRYRSQFGPLPYDEPDGKEDDIDEIEAKLNLEMAQAAEESAAAPSLNEILDQSAITRRRMKLWEETMGECIYCGDSITATDFLTGVNSDIEHIIPRALGGTSCLDNTVCSCRICNREKGELTAFDYMMSKDSSTLHSYLKRIRALATAQMISKEKYINLLLTKRLVNDK